MARVKGGYVARRRRKAVLKHAKGFFQGRRRLFSNAKEAVVKAWTNSYKDRRRKKRDFRRLWITRISAATKLRGLSYSKFIFGLKTAGVEVNRKMLSEIAISDEKTFDNLVEVAKNNIK